MKAPSKSMLITIVRSAPTTKMEMAEISATEQPNGLSKVVFLNLLSNKRLAITIDEMIKRVAFRVKSALQSAK